MNVLVAGVKPRDPREGIFFCPKCESVVEITREDLANLKFHRGYGDDQRDGDWWGFDCPVCGYEHSTNFPLKPEQIARRLKDAAQARRDDVETDPYGGDYLDNRDRIARLESDFNDLEARMSRLESRTP